MVSALGLVEKYSICCDSTRENSSFIAYASALCATRPYVLEKRVLISSRKANGIRPAIRDFFVNDAIALCFDVFSCVSVCDDRKEKSTESLQNVVCLKAHVASCRLKEIGTTVRFCRKMFCMVGHLKTSRDAIGNTGCQDCGKAHKRLPTVSFVHFQHFSGSGLGSSTDDTT